MSFDLRAALLRKGEAESARLDDFAFRERAGTMRLLVGTLGEDADTLVHQIATASDATIVEGLAIRHDREKLAAAYERARAAAHAQLIVERGDPTPHRLA